MPIFEYHCDSCHHEFEMLVRPGDTPACPKCAATGLTKLLSLPAIKSDTTHDLALRAAKKTTGMFRLTRCGAQIQAASPDSTSA